MRRIAGLVSFVVLMVVGVLPVFSQTPVFSPAEGKYTATQTVKITSSLSNAVIHYTLNGETPTAASPVYSAALTVRASETLAAIAISSSKTSSVSWATYQIVPTTPTTPTANTTSSYYGVDMNYLLNGSSWPLIPSNTLRLWDSQTMWENLNPKSGTYTWTNLDKQINLAKANSAAVMLTFGGTPKWTLPSGITITSMTRSSGIVTVTTSRAHGLYYNPLVWDDYESSFTIAGASNSAFNGTFKLLSTPTTTTLTFAQTGSDATATGGTLSAVCGGDYASSSACAEAPADLTNWDNFLTALMAHVGSGQIAYFELWNEANTPNFWRGDPAVLETMAAHARTIIHATDANAIILTPSVTENYDTAAGCSTDALCGSSWLSNYLAIGGGAVADAVAYHGYPVVDASPERSVGTVNLLRSVMSQNGYASLPLWDTESSWGENTSLTSSTDRANFLARHLILQQSAGAQRSFWYAYDSDSWGSLWSSSTGLNASGVAYKQVASWISGATMSQNCAASSSNSKIWTCLYTRSNGYSAEIVWMTSGTSTFTVPSKFAQYRDLSGTTHTAGSTVTISTSPIILETTSATQYPSLTSPTASSTLTSTSATFTWSTGTIAPSAYKLLIGTTKAGSSDVYSGSSTTATSVTVSSIPTLGATLYVRLSYQVSGTWYYLDYTLTEATARKATLASPSSQSTLTSSSITVTWNAGVGTSAYQLLVGTGSQGASNVYSGKSTTATTVSMTVPTKGAKLYVRLLSYLNGAWTYTDYSYTEASK